MMATPEVVPKENNYNHKTHTCSEELISQYVGRYRQELIPAGSQCETAGGKSTELFKIGETILKTALSSVDCEKEARAGSSPSKPNLNQVQAVTASGNLGSPYSTPTENPLLSWSANKEDSEVGGNGHSSSGSGGSDSNRDSLSVLSPTGSGNQIDEGNNLKQGALSPADKESNDILSGVGGSYFAFPIVIVLTLSPLCFDRIIFQIILKKKIGSP